MKNEFGKQLVLQCTHLGRDSETQFIRMELNLERDSSYGVVSYQEPIL